MIMTTLTQNQKRGVFLMIRYACVLYMYKRIVPTSLKHIYVSILPTSLYIHTHFAHMAKLKHKSSIVVYCSIHSYGTHSKILRV